MSDCKASLACSNAFCCSLHHFHLLFFWRRANSGDKVVDILGRKTEKPKERLEFSHMWLLGFLNTFDLISCWVDSQFIHLVAKILHLLCHEQTLWLLQPDTSSLQSLKHCCQKINVAPVSYQSTGCHPCMQLHEGFP